MTPICVEKIWTESCPSLSKYLMQTWTVDNIIHRENGPAIIIYYDGSKTNLIYEEHWLQYDKRHRLDGPALIRYSRDGTILYSDWYINGQAKHVSTLCWLLGVRELIVPLSEDQMVLLKIMLG